MSKDIHRDQWLIRDSKNLIWGPVSRAEVVNLLRTEKLKAKTEISCSLSYWFAIEEKSEMANFFPEIVNEIADDIPEGGTEVSISGETKTVPGEWLSDEYAEEFGYVIEENADGTTVARRKIDDAKEKDGSGFEPSFTDDEPTYVPAMDEDTNPTLSDPEILELQSKAKRRKFFIGVGAALVFLVLGAFALESLFLSRPIGNNTIEINVPHREDLVADTISSLKVALLMGDISRLNEEIAALSTIATESEKKGEEFEYSHLIPIARAVMKREFLFDSTDAIAILKRTENGLNLKPQQSAEVLNLLGIYSLENDPVQAIENFDKALMQLNDDAVIKYNLALALIEKNRVKDARAALNAINEGLTNENLLKATLLETLGRISVGSASIQFLREALALNPELDQAQLMIIMQKLRIQAGDVDNEIDAFIDFLPGFLATQRVRNLRQASLKPIYADMRKILRETIAKRRAKANLLSLDGVLSTMLGDYEEAEQALQRSLALEPGNLNAMKGLAYLRLRDGKEFEIENLIRAKTEANPNSFALNALLGMSYLRQGKTADAALSFKKLTKNHAGISSSWSWLGATAVKLGDTESGIRYFQKALGANPYDLAALQGLTKAGAADKVRTDALVSLLPF